MGYNNYNREFEVNEDKTTDLLQNALSKITTEEDIDTLTELIKLFKKNIPLSRRKYVTAYLLKDALLHYHSYGRNNNRNIKNRNNRDYKNDIKPSKQNVEVTDVETEERPHHPRVEIDPDKATSIFVSIGKNRRVYPRDIVGLLVAVGGIDRERIGDIKVLTNYSFVQLYTEDCQTAIDKLNGYEYRGRKLAVSFSRKKSDEESAENTEDLSSTEYTQNEYVENAVSDASEADMTAEDAAAYAAAEKAAADKQPFGV